MTGIKNNKYRITLEEIELKDRTTADKSVTFEFVNHDNIFDIIDRLQSKSIFANPEEELEFAVGLKLFSEVMLRQRDNPLFDELKKAFGPFMKKLKEK